MKKRRKKAKRAARKKKAPSRRQSAGEKAPARAPADQLRALRGMFDRELRSGYATRSDLLRRFADDVDGEWPLVTKAAGAALVGELIAAARRRQARWPKTTDNDRLARAFAALESEGIVSREDYWCCMTCGLAAIGADMAEAERELARPVVGYTFFHTQDTEGAAEGRGLYLAFGAKDDGEAAGVAIGRRVTDALRAAGLEVAWDGSFGRRIAVAMRWQKRLPAR